MATAGDITISIIAIAVGLLALFMAWIMMQSGTSIVFVGIYALATVLMMVMQVVSQCIVKRLPPTKPEDRRGPVPQAWGITNGVFTLLFIVLSLYVAYVIFKAAPTLLWGFIPSIITLLVVGSVFQRVHVPP